MSNKQPEWEKKLQQMRAKRDSRPSEQPETHTATAPAPTQATEKKHRLHAEFKRQVMKNYLKSWQARHNAALAGELTETDTTVLLEEDWLNAQNALQGNIKPEDIQEKQTVWLNPKRQSAQTPIAEEPEENADSTEAVPALADIPVNVNVLNPQGVPGNRPVFCLSEQELIDRLMQRLMPHLTDAVNGVVRTAITRQAANATGKSDEAACERAFINAAHKFQATAQSRNANRVSNFHSYYNRKILRGGQYDCEVGTFHARVVMRGDIAR